ncbi:MAG TPA: hypothetical protein VFQ45_13855 [Longimicrobium sp.]|nr:hypothetical protein [Longimicrobium sp.]
MHPFLRVLAVCAAAAAPVGARSQSPPQPDVAEALAREGIAAAPPPGFAAFVRDKGRPGLRLYRSTAEDDRRFILIGVFDGPGMWGFPDDLEVRHDQFRMVSEVFHDSTQLDGEVSRLDDSTHLVSSTPIRFGKAGRGVVQVAVPRAGAPVGVAIQVVDISGGTDPGADRQVLAFLAAARPRPTDGLQADRVTFARAGVEMRFPPGVGPPVETVRKPDGTRIFESYNGGRILRVMVFPNERRGADAWPPARRQRHLQPTLASLMETLGGRGEEPVYTIGPLAYRIFRFREKSGSRVLGHGRLYTTLTGPHRMAVVMYSETGRAPVLDDEAVASSFNTLRFDP